MDIRARIEPGYRDHDLRHDRGGAGAAKDAGTDPIGPARREKPVRPGDPDDTGAAARADGCRGRGEMALRVRGPGDRGPERVHAEKPGPAAFDPILGIEAGSGSPAVRLL